MATYDELRLGFAKAGDAYTVRASSPEGEANAPVAIDVSPLEIENMVLRVSRTRTRVRRVESPELDLVRRFGSRLFSAVFTGPIRDLYRESLGASRGRGNGLRITLELDGAPELMHLPWEYLYEEPSFLAISTWTPVVRSLHIAHARPPLAITPPLRVLAMVSSPTDVVQLDVAAERAKLEGALAESIARGAIEIEWLERATLAALQRALRRGDYHVFHFVGHGVFDADREDGLLLLEEDDGRSREVSGVHLGTMLADERSLRLAVLNACEGARTSTDDPFAGVAASLVQREIPAVVAMQFEITDRAALVFAGEFYAAVADGYAVDASLAEARKAIYADDNDIEWATPVLFMRAPEGLVFEVASPAPRPAHEPHDESKPEPEPAPEPEPEPEPDRWGELEGRAPTPVLPEPQAEPQPDPEPARARLPIGVAACAAVAAALQLLVVFASWDTDARPDSWARFYHDSAAAFHGLLAPLAVVVGMVAALVALFARGIVPFALGALAGLGASGAALDAGVLVRQAHFSGSADRTGSAVLALGGAASVLVAVMAARAAAREREEADTPLRVSGLAVAVGLATALVLAGLLVPFNGGGANAGFSDPSAVLPDRWPDEAWAVFHPAVVLVGAWAAVAAAAGGHRRFAAGLLGALGAVGACVWWRYAIVPIDLDDRFGSAAAGGFLGLAGALLLVWAARRAGRAATARGLP